MANDSDNEYGPRLKFVAIVSIISLVFAVFFFIQWQSTNSLIYIFLFLISLAVFVFFFYPIFLNQKIKIEDGKITFLHRFKKSLTVQISESLYEIITRSDKPVSFRFRSGRRRAQLSPRSYRNGDKLHNLLTERIKKERIVAKIISK